MKELLTVIAVVMLGIVTSQFIGGVTEKTPAEDIAEINRLNREASPDGILLVRQFH